MLFPQHYVGGSDKSRFALVPWLLVAHAADNTVAHGVPVRVHVTLVNMNAVPIEHTAALAMHRATLTP